MNETQKKQARLRKQRQRDKERDIGERDTDSVTKENVTQCPPIIHALADPVKRAKLEKIYESLKTFKQEENVYYGCGKHSMPFDMVGEYLEATR